MAVFSLLAVGFILKVIAVLFVFSAIALVLIVLIQKGKGGGLSGALAGGMASGILGSKTGDFLTWVTIGLVAAFLFLAVIMAKFYRPTIRDIGRPGVTQQQPLRQQPTTAVPPAALAETEPQPADTNSPSD